MPLLFAITSVVFTIALLSAFALAIKNHAWAAVSAILAFFSPYAGVLYLLLPNFLYDRGETASDSLDGPKVTLSEKLKTSIGSLDVLFLADVDDARNWAVRSLIRLMDFVSTLLSWPIIVLNTAISYRYQHAFRRRGFDAIWKLILITISYVLSQNDLVVVGISLALTVTFIEVGAIANTMQTRNGVVVFFKYDESLGRVSYIIKKALLVVASFGACHFGLMRHNSKAYNETFDVFTSLYFSLVTFTTVGYGDFYPKSWAAKAACMAEMISGVVTLILAINMAVSIWLQQHQPPTSRSAE